MTSVKTAEFVVPLTETLMTCMRRLDETRHKTLFVVDEQQAIVGALTDGDIRRWILAGHSLAAAVDQVCNRSPVSMPAGSTRDELLQVMRLQRVDAIPLVDTMGIITSVAVRRLLEDGAPTEVPGVGRIDVPVVIMAGGAGSRLQPFTTILPKPLIPIGDRPVVEHIIDRFRTQGADNFLMSIGHKARLIRAYFEEHLRDYTLAFYEEERALGTAGALSLMQASLPDVFLVTNCDILVTADFADFLEFHRAGGHLISLISSVRRFQVPYGVCDIDPGGRLVAIREKPEHHYLISTGVYALQRDALALIPDGTPMHMTELIAAAQAQGHSVGVYPISEGAWSDMGEWPEYQKTVARLLAHAPAGGPS